MFPAFSLKVEAGAIADFLRDVYDPLDVITIAVRLRHGTRALLAARGESRGDVATFFIEETEDAGRVTVASKIAYSWSSRGWNPTFGTVLALRCWKIARRKPGDVFVKALQVQPSTS